MSYITDVLPMCDTYEYQMELCGEKVRNANNIKNETKELLYRMIEIGIPVFHINEQYNGTSDKEVCYMKVSKLCDCHDYNMRHIDCRKNNSYVSDYLQSLARKHNCFIHFIGGNFACVSECNP